MVTYVLRPPNVSTAALRAALFLAGLLTLAACDNFSNVTVNCQVGMKNLAAMQRDGEQLPLADPSIAHCEFRNHGNRPAATCIKVHLFPADCDHPKGECPAAFVSSPRCSGTIQPQSTTSALPLDFPNASIQQVAAACVTEDNGEPRFHCDIKLEEVAP